MKFLVTGGNGFIGANLIRKLIDEGYSVISVDDLSSGKVKNLSPAKELKIIYQKIQDIKIDDIDHDIDGIFHLAAQASVPFSIENYFDSSSNNLLGSLRIWEFSIKRCIPIVYASSSAVYGNFPSGDDRYEKFDILSPYALDKLTMENYAKLCHDIYNIPSIGLRFFNVYGPLQDALNPYSGVISIFIDRLLKNKSVIVNGGYQNRDFVYIDDVINVMNISMKTLQKKNMCESYNVGTGISTTIDNLLDNISKLINVIPKISRKKLPKGDPESSIGNYEKLIGSLNIELNNFTKLTDGLRETIDFMKKSTI
jgi:UDP-glucose 4-epimerase